MIHPSALSLSAKLAKKFCRKRLLLRVSVSAMMLKSCRSYRRFNEHQLLLPVSVYSSSRQLIRLEEHMLAHSVKERCILSFHRHYYFSRYFRLSSLYDMEVLLTRRPLFFTDVSFRLIGLPKRTVISSDHRPLFPHKRAWLILKGPH